MYSCSANAYPGTVCRENFWSKTTTALGAMQVSVGLGFLTFSFSAYVIDLHFPYQLRFVGIGTMTGSVIVCAGVIGLFTAKKRSKLMVSILMLFSLLALFCALFPMVIGILGARSSASEQEGHSLLLPICQLVFSTVEIVVAAWTIGLCVQAFCCPNISLGIISVQQPAGYGLSRMLVTEDGYHNLGPVVSASTDRQMYGHSQLLLQHPPTGFHYVPIVTTGGMLHGIQTNNTSMRTSPQTTLTSPLASPDAEPALGTAAPVTDVAASAGEKLCADHNPDEEREDVCLLP